MIILIFVWGVRPCSVRVTREINEVGGLSSTQLPNQNRPIGSRVDNCGGGGSTPNSPGNAHSAAASALVSIPEKIGLLSNRSANLIAYRCLARFKVRQSTIKQLSALCKLR